MRKSRLSIYVVAAEIALTCLSSININAPCVDTSWMHGHMPVPSGPRGHVTYGPPKKGRGGKVKRW